VSRNQYSYNPLDLQPDIAIGIKLPFNASAYGKSDINSVTNYSSNSAGGSVFVLSYTTEEQSISNLKNLILTRKGERLMHPEFGTRLYNSLFEQNTDTLLETIQIELTDDINYWLPYIVLNKVDVQTSDDRQSITISIVFKVTQQGSGQTITVFVSQNGIELI
jgi:phage baseplate assembly protein W